MKDLPAGAHVVAVKGPSPTNRSLLNRDKDVSVIDDYFDAYFVELSSPKGLDEELTILACNVCKDVVPPKPSFQVEVVGWESWMERALDFAMHERRRDCSGGLDALAGLSGVKPQDPQVDADLAYLARLLAKGTEKVVEDPSDDESGARP